MKAISYLLIIRISAHLFFHEKPTKTGHCAGKFIRLKRKSKKKTIIQNLKKKFNQFLETSSVEAVENIIYIFKQLSFINCVLI